MKRNNKGFTLAELLIVIAIIAILIAIAIPAFGSALDNARLQTDHANMRSCYAMMQVGSLQGYIETGATNAKVTLTDTSAVGKYYFNADGTLSAKATSAPTSAYKTSAKGDTTKCAASAFCQKITPAAHVKGVGFGIEVKTGGEVSAFIDTATTPGP